MSSDPKPRRGRPSSGAAKTTVTVGGLLRKTVYFDDEEWQAIRRASYDADVAFSDVVRTAVRRDLGLASPETTRRQEAPAVRRGTGSPRTRR